MAEESTPKASIYKSSPLSFISDYLREAVLARRSLSAPVLLNDMLSRKNNIFSELLSKLKGTKFWPESFLAIGDLSYVVAELAGHFSTEEQLTIAVENPQEAKIFSNMKKISRCLNISPNIIGLYPQSKIFYRTMLGELIRNLYFSRLKVNELPSYFFDHLASQYNFMSSSRLKKCC